MIGFMGESTAEGQRQWVSAFVQRLSERGWTEGRNIAIEYRWAEGRNERFPEIVAELVRLKVDVIVTQGTPAVLAAKQATSVIPVVFAIAGNPVANGLVATRAGTMPAAPVYRAAAAAYRSGDQAAGSRPGSQPGGKGGLAR